MQIDASHEMTVQQAADALRSGALLVDVREGFEWVQGHAPEAVHLPMSEIGSRIGELATDRVILCVCHVGGRSAVVSDALRRGGWNAVNVAGGMQAWSAAGFPVVNDAGEPGFVD